VIGWAGAARAELDRVLPRRTAQAARDSAALPSLGALVRRRMGRRVLTRLVQPVAGGVYSTDPDDLDIASAAPDLAAHLGAGHSLARTVAALRGAGPAAGSAVDGIVGGMALLTEALAARFTAAGGTLRCGVRVREVNRRDGGWRVLADSAVGAAEGATAEEFAAEGATTREFTAEGATAEEFAAAAVVLAVPGAVAAPLIARATDGVAQLPVAPPTHVGLVTLVVDAPELDAAPRGSGLLVAPGVSDVAAKALTHATAKWRWLAEQAGPHRHVLRLSYGRGSGPADGPDTHTDADMVDLALRDAGRLLGVTLTRSHLHAHAITYFTGQLAASRAGQAAARARFQQQIAGVDGLSVVGSAVAGTGLGAVVANATGAPLVTAGRKEAGSRHDES
jgi:oxygen-dependent protoporphyrinogen oxidase